MQITNVLEYLEKTVKEVPEKTAYAEEGNEVSFEKVYKESRAIGSYLINHKYYNEPVVVFMPKRPQTIVAFFGVVYGGCYYIPMDLEMPEYRIELIIENLKPRIIISDAESEEKVAKYKKDADLVLYDDIANTSENEEGLLSVRDRQIDTDPLYVVFTSGSTGVPKGVVANHRSVIDYIENLSAVLGFSRDTVYGSQAPLYFDACLKEVYPTLKFGATTWLIPKKLFMFPIKLVEFLNVHRVNTICWVVSALTMISGMKTFEKIKPEYLSNIAFGSEVFPIKQFRLWREALPNAKFTNLYGPTECTGMSCYYHVDRDFELDEKIPVGKPFHNTRVYLLDENGKEVPSGGTGEICISGTPVTMGYYNDPERTREAFVQNPLNSRFMEIIYKTGDLGHYDADRNIIFESRKDYQIKHMGHRIELGEIEVVINALDEIVISACIYDQEKSKIVLYYQGDITEKDVIVYLKSKLPPYMMPNRTIRLDKMPFTANGKIDRKSLQSMK